MTTKLKEALRIAEEIKTNPDFDPQGVSEYFDNKHETSFMQVIYDAARAYSELAEKIEGLLKEIPETKDEYNSTKMVQATLRSEYNKALIDVLEILKDQRK